MQETNPGDAADPHGGGPDERAVALANALFAMAREGETERLAAYLQAGAPLEMRNQNGDTMLILAAYHSHPTTVAMLLDAGADPEAANDRGQRALSCAVFKQDEPTVRLLMAAGADPNAGSPSALQTARMFGAEAILELLAQERG
ncbi:MAG: ankyrin repeat domain-containing protein [Pseudoclavibacter sp.]|nr:ankyrin repeat domain-containing protein [Pseudoclavibacter sp.]